MTLLLVTIAWLAVNVGLTLLVKPSLFRHAEFWLLQVRAPPCVYHVFVGPRQTDGWDVGTFVARSG